MPEDSSFTVSGGLLRERFHGALYIPWEEVERTPCRSCRAAAGQSCNTMRKSNGGIHPVRRLEAFLGDQFLPTMRYLIGINHDGVRETKP